MFEKNYPKEKAAEKVIEVANNKNGESILEVAVCTEVFLRELLNYIQVEFIREKEVFPRWNCSVSRTCWTD